MIFVTVYSYVLQVIIFIDCEGTPVQEFSALAMDTRDNVVIAAYHRYAYCPPDKDKWARKHIHGLEPKLLKEFGFSCENELFEDVNIWLSTFPNIETIYANNPLKERRFLKLPIQDIGLPIWSERIGNPYHRIPNNLKNDGDYLFMELNVYCDPDFHGQFSHHLITNPNNVNHMAKASETYHCSLCDVTELFLFYREHSAHRACFQ